MLSGLLCTDNTHTFGVIKAATPENKPSSMVEETQEYLNSRD